MSGRIRTLKPELLEDDRTASLSHEAWRMFVSMILLADDYGNLRANPKLLDGQVFWARESLAGLSRILRELVESGLVAEYSVRGQKYVTLTGWAKHQRVDKPGKPRVPGPEKADSEAVPDSSESFANDSGMARETLAPDLRPPTPTNDPDRRAAVCASAHDHTAARRRDTEPQLGGEATGAVVQDPPRNQRAVPSDVVSTPWRTRAPSNLAEALTWPLEARSKACLDFDGEWAVPQQWPEVVSVASGLASALGRSPGRLGSIRRDTGVQAVLGLYADGVTHEELMRAVEATARDEWWRQGRRGLASLTPEVVRRLLEGGARPERQESAAEFLKREKARRLEATHG